MGDGLKVDAVVSGESTSCLLALVIEALLLYQQ